MVKALYSDRAYLKVTEKRAKQSRLWSLAGMVVLVIIGLVNKVGTIRDYMMGTAGKALVAFVVLGIIVCLLCKFLWVRAAQNRAKKSWIDFDGQALAYNIALPQKGCDKRKIVKIESFEKIVETYEKYNIYGNFEITTVGTFDESKLKRTVKKVSIPKYFDNLDMIMDAFAKKQNIKI